MRAHENQKAALLFAMSKMKYLLYTFTDDIDDFDDGPNLFGSPATSVVGHQLAIEAAGLMIRRDPSIRFVKCVPAVAEGGLKPFNVRRVANSETGRMSQDPTRGDEEFRVQRRKTLDELRRRPNDP